MLNNTLNANEIKNSAGTGVSFTRLSTKDRSTEFALTGETPSQPHRLKIAHQESGVGMKKRRRSVVRFDKTVISGVDNITPITISYYAVADIPVGAMSSDAESKNVAAELVSFCASLGASTTILYDNTGNGLTVLKDGGL